MCINLVRPSKGFHTNFYWLYQVDLPDVCLKCIFVFVFFSNQASQTKHKSLLKSVYPFDEPFIFLGHLSEFIPGHWCQTRENYIYFCEYLGLDVCALLLLTREKDITFLIVLKAQDSAHWAVRADIWFTATAYMVVKLHWKPVTHLGIPLIACHLSWT